jgi:2-polyprenyl-3-methyl-5-hydroxy-6-metoxy-1,4-benzoquinol methylase
MSQYWRLKVTKYKGLSARCAPGTHEAVVDTIARHNVPRGKLLDLAAGTGALLARLQDSGFKDVRAVELDVDSFHLPGVKPLSVDLNTDFSRTFDGQFDVVTAVEIIEHLDSPRHFLRQIWQLLSPGGYLMVSTPNIGHWVGRLRFAAQGELRYFREGDYHHQRHISPINHTHMRLMLREIGFDLIDYRTAGSFYGPLKRIVTAPVTGFFRALQGPHTTGDVNIYLARKTQPDDSSAGRSSTVYVHRHDRAPKEPVPEAEPVA